MPFDHPNASGSPGPDPLFHKTRSSSSTRAPADVDLSWRTEKNILLFSLGGAAFFAALGLIWGTVIGSQMLKFDGIYSFVSVILSGLTVFFAKAVREKDEDQYPFGRSQMEPLFMVLKSLVFLVVCAHAFVFAMKTFLAGGRDLNDLSAASYAVIGIIGCLAGWLVIVMLRKRAGMSAFVHAEARQWFQDMLLSVVLLFGFLGSYYLKSQGHAEIARYVDPFMTMTAALVFMINPVLMMISGLRDMLLIAPGELIYSSSREVLRDIAMKHSFEGFLLKIRGSGRTLLYEISYTTDDRTREFSVADLDAIRQEVSERLDAILEQPKNLLIGFTAAENQD